MMDYDRELRLQDTSEKLYSHIMRELSDGTHSEAELRYFVVTLAHKLLEGVNISLRMELMKQDFATSMENDLTQETDKST